MLVFHQHYNSYGHHQFSPIVFEDVHSGLHFHKNCEIIYVLKGSAYCVVNKNGKVIHEGEFAFFLSNEIHDIKTLEGGRIWISVFSEDFINEFVKSLKGRTGADFTFKCCEPVHTYLLENMINKEKPSLFSLKSCLYAICEEYLKANRLVERNKMASVISDILAYVEANYKNSITLSDISKSLGYEYCYFSKNFKKLFSMSFNDYLNIYRFNEACNLIANSGLSMTGIAHESGFKSIRNFNYVFKKLAGISPSEYAKRLM